MNEKDLKGWRIYIRSNKSVVVSRTYTNTKEGLIAIVNSAKLNVDISGTTRQIGAAVLKELGGDTNAKHGEYLVSKSKEGSFTVCRTYTNTKEGLKELSEMAGFSYKAEWNTRYFGKKLAEKLAEHLVSKGHNELVRTSLLKDVCCDIKNFLHEANKLFFNERDLQVHLATYFKNRPWYDDVELEYFIPQMLSQTEVLPDYEWKTKIYIDIVVRRGEEYLPIELKYATKAIKQEIERFGEVLPECEVVKKQGANNLTCYYYWKDVRRLEHLKNSFNHVKHGIALLLTNENSYKKPKSGNKVCAYDNFRLCEGKSGRDKHWLGASTGREKNPNFTLDNEYNVSWKSTSFGDSNEHEFHYCLIEV